MRCGDEYDDIMLTDFHFYHNLWNSFQSTAVATIFSNALTEASQE